MPIHHAADTAALHPDYRPEDCLHIGLLNNMPDGALEATERQYLALLETAASDLPVRFSLFSLPDVPRSSWGRNQVNRRYLGVEELWDSSLDGLIVTGAEPRAADLSDEPYWNSLTDVLAWARQETSSTVWSCLAAHAAIQHMHGIRRRPLPEKRFGVFPCIRDGEHDLTDGLPRSFSVPHSRWNDVAADALVGCGYHVLTRLEDGSADAWLSQQGRSLFVFLQGHPEYETATLLLEYRRDVMRYLKGERTSYPGMPDCYFDGQGQDALEEFKARVLAGRQPLPPTGAPLAEFPVHLSGNLLPNTWRPVAARFYANWLRKLSEERARVGVSRGRYRWAAASAAGD